MLLFGMSANAEFRPQSIKDLYKTSVRIYDKGLNSGGTGSIFKSFKTGSHILTNKHVCKLVEQGGYVEYKDRNFLVTHYKKFPQHDLCLVRVASNLRVDLKVSETLVKKSSTVYVSGHPNLLPHIATKGHVSDHMDIDLIVGMRDCTKDDIEKDPLSCAWFGGLPEIQTFDSQVVSNLIKPGSSGSAVFNTNGEIVGVVYAGSGRGFSHGFIVPHLYVIYFIQNSHRFDWVKVGTKVDSKGLKNRIFNYEKCKSPILEMSDKYKKIKDFCKNIKDNAIWSK